MVLYAACASARVRDASWIADSQVVDCLSRYKTAINDLYPSAAILAAGFNLRIEENTTNNLSRVNQLANLIEIAESDSIGYIITNLISLQFSI